MYWHFRPQVLFRFQTHMLSDVHDACEVMRLHAWRQSPVTGFHMQRLSVTQVVIELYCRLQTCEQLEVTPSHIHIVSDEHWSAVP